MTLAFPSARNPPKRCRKAERLTRVTVGQFLSQVKAVSGLKPGTFEIYAKKFRGIVAGVFNINVGNEKHDYVKGGHQRWLKRIHAVYLDKLTPDRVNKWRVRRLEAVKDNSLKLKQASVTVRSMLLSSRAFFAQRIRRHLCCPLPSPLPFENVELPRVGHSRYRSEINPAALLQDAQRELATAKPEHYKILLLLALGAGLRRDEIDSLEWTQFLWDRNAIRIMTSEFSSTKSGESENDVYVDPALMAIFKEFKAKSSGRFVIESRIAPRPQAHTYHHYRCYRIFRELLKWLRTKGITARNALHSLRKEFGRKSVSRQESLRRA